MAGTIEAKIVFVDARAKSEYERLKTSTTEDKMLLEQLNRAFDDLEKNAFCGVQIAKKLIPKEYRKYDIDNLWKYDLPKGWRLLYSVKGGEAIIISIIIEWLPHKKYERRFGY